MKMDGIFVKRIDEHLAHLHDGIQSRREMLAQNPTTRQKKDIDRQIENWEAEYTKFHEDLEKHSKLVARPWPDDQEHKRVEIICLKYKDDTVEERCLRELNEHTFWPYKLNWFNNRDPQKYTTANFAKAWNVLTQQSTCDYIVIMDSDAFVTDHWLTRMMQSFDRDFTCRNAPGGNGIITKPKKVGMVVPVTHAAGAHTIQGKYRNDPASKAPFVTDAQVSGFFFLFKKEMFNDIGGFDERFYLHGQDSEWIDRIMASDWEIVIRPDVFVDHQVSASIMAAKEREEFSYDMDIFWTQTTYDVIRNEKQRGVYEPY